jgi:hypothetical protein
MKIISEWRSLAHRLPSLEPSSACLELNIAAAQLAGLETEIELNGLALADFLRSLADECERFLQQSEWMCILGM